MLESNDSLALYRMMLLIRQCEESFVPLILDGTIRCPVHLYSGEEAIAVGVCSALTKADYIFGTHRSHGHFLAKGGSLQALVAEVYCREAGCSRGRGGSMHLTDPAHGILGAAPIVGGTISLAVGSALASQIRRDGRVTVAFFGDGATGEGVLHEAMNFASLRKLPLLFVCENNLYSTHMPVRDIRVSTPISDLGKAFGMVSHRADGNELEQVCQIAANSVELCRSGGGPVLLEFLTYRQRGHVGPNDNIQGTKTDIRPADEVAEWQRRDPISLFEARLMASGLTTQNELRSIRDAIDNEVRAAHQEARSSAKPDPSELERYVFSE